MDPEYWAELESRIVEDIAARMPSRPTANAGVWAPLAARAWTLGGLAVAATLATLLLVPPRPSFAPNSLAGLLRVPEDDGLLEAFLAAPAPPAAAWLVIAGTEAPR